MILKQLYRKKKQLCILIDPDKYTKESLIIACDTLNKMPIDFILIGGSLVQNPLNESINILKKHTKFQIIIFPGSLLQVENNADAIFLLSLISGRNPDFLIGNHVNIAPILKKSKLEILPVGYILVESGKMTSVEYMSNTKPIPNNKVDIAVATAIAGEILGLKLIYLEAGSGAEKKVSLEMIKSVKENINIPLIVGGGIKTQNDIENIFNAGADIIVIGTAFEKNIYHN